MQMETEITVLVKTDYEKLKKEFQERKIPYILVWNKCDLIQPPPPLEGGSKSLISGWGISTAQPEQSHFS